MNRRSKFVADQMLGRLAKWMRLLGYDTYYCRDIDDARLLRIAKTEKRILVTRDSKLCQRRPIKRGEIVAVLIESEHLENQLKQLFQVLNLCPTLRKLSLCAYCNVPLEKAAKEEVEEKVPAYVYQNQKDFSRCSKCGRIYWKGTHFKEINQRISNLVKEITHK